MEKSAWVKIVWLGAFVAIPAAVIAVQKPAPRRAVETHRVITLEQPVSVDINDRQIEGARLAEPAASAETPKAQAVRLGAEKITLREGAPGAAAAPKTETPAKSESAPIAPKMDSLPSLKEQSLTILAPVAGPQK